MERLEGFHSELIERRKIAYNGINTFVGSSMNEHVRNLALTEPEKTALVAHGMLKDRAAKMYEGTDVADWLNTDTTQEIIRRKLLVEKSKVYKRAKYKLGRIYDQVGSGLV